MRPAGADRKSVMRSSCGKTVELAQVIPLLHEVDAGEKESAPTA